MSHEEICHGGHGEHGGLVDCDEELIDAVLTAATRVHSALGPGLLEAVYEAALCVEFDEMRVVYRRQLEVPVRYRGRLLGIGFRADLVVADSLLIELKSVAEIAPIHLAVTINYLKLLNLKRGYILNFNRRLLKEGIKRVSN